MAFVAQYAPCVDGFNHDLCDAAIAAYTPPFCTLRVRLSCVVTLRRVQFVCRFLDRLIGNLSP